MGGGLILGAIVALRVLPAVVHAYEGLRERAAERTAVLERARAALRSAPFVQDSFAVAAREISALAPRLVAGATAAEAAATLTSELSAVAQRAGLRVIGFNALPDSSAGAFRPVALHADLEGDIGGLTALLRAVEGATALLTVRSIHVLAADPLERQPGPELLRVELVMVGWRVEAGTS